MYFIIFILFLLLVLIILIVVFNIIFVIKLYIFNLGSISDWSLLLYGTEDPAQPNDKQYSANLMPKDNRITSIITQVSNF